MSHIQNLSYYIDSIFQALEDQENSTRKPIINELAVDGEIAVVGGSDTTAITLSCVFYYLLTGQEYCARLRKETNQMLSVGEEGSFDGTRLAQMKFLNAVM